MLVRAVRMRPYGVVFPSAWKNRGPGVRTRSDLRLFVSRAKGGRFDGLAEADVVSIILAADLRVALVILRRPSACAPVAASAGRKNIESPPVVQPVASRPGHVSMEPYLGPTASDGGPTWAPTSITRPTAVTYTRISTPDRLSEGKCWAASSFRYGVPGLGPRESRKPAPGLPCKAARRSVGQVERPTRFLTICSRENVVSPRRSLLRVRRPHAGPRTRLAPWR